jgi:hypothetical protein
MNTAVREEPLVPPGPAPRYGSRMRRAMAITLAERRALLRRRRGGRFWRKLLVILFCVAAVVWLVLFGFSILQPL